MYRKAHTKLSSGERSLHDKICHLVFIRFIAPALFAGDGFSTWKTRQVELVFPNPGERMEGGGYSLNSVLVPRPKRPISQL